MAWAIGFPGAVRVRSQPAFAGGYLLLGSQDGAVYALDAKTGCQHWKFQAASEVRTSIAITEWARDATDPQPVAVFGDYLGNVYGVSVRTGARLWKVRPHEHPHATITGTPRIFEGRVYVAVASHEDGSAVRPDYPCCTFRGAVAALDVNTGATQWLTYTVAEPATPRKLNRAGTRRWGSSGAATWTTPAIDAGRRQVYIGTGDNYSGPATATSDSIIAMDLDTGSVRWVFQATEGDTWNGACMLEIKGPNCPEEEGPDYDFGASVVIVSRAAGDLLLAGQKSGAVFALDPDTGKQIWTRKPGAVAAFRAECTSVWPRPAIWFLSRFLTWPTPRTQKSTTTRRRPDCMRSMSRRASWSGGGWPLRTCAGSARTATRASARRPR